MGEVHVNPRATVMKPPNCNDVNLLIFVIANLKTIFLLLDSAIQFPFNVLLLRRHNNILSSTHEEHDKYMKMVALSHICWF